MARTTIEKVGTKALREPAFLEELIRNPEKALWKEDLVLPPGELEALKTIVESNAASVNVKPIDLIKLVHESGSDPVIETTRLWKNP